MTKPRRRQAGEGTISTYETKAGTRYLIKYTAVDANGERKVVLRRRDRDGQPFLTRKAAAAELGDILSEVRQGAHVVPKKLTVGDWLDQWLEGLQLEQSTRASYEKNVRLHLKPHIGGVQLQSLTGARLSALYRELEKSGRQDHKAGTGLSPRTVRYCHTIMKAALSDAVNQGLVASNAADKAKPPSARASQAPDMHPWTGAQLNTFLSWLEASVGPDAPPKRGRPVQPAIYPALRTLAFTGMRRGEALALRWRDLDLTNARLAVRRSVGVVKKKGEGERVVEGPTKSARPRVIDLDEQTVLFLKAWRRERGAASLQLVHEDSLIFGDLEGGFLHPERFSRTFVEKQEQCRRSGTGVDLPAIHLHDLRHTHATLLLQAGVPVKVVSERLGHANVTITLNIYAHVMPGMQAQAAATFAALVGGGA